MKTRDQNITTLFGNPCLFIFLLTLYLSLITKAGAVTREEELMRFWAIPDLEQTILNWTHHPKASLYRLEVDGVTLEDSTSSHCQINLSPALENGSEVKLQAKVNGQWRAVGQLTLSSGEPYQQSFAIQKGRVVADYRLISFPAGAWVWDGEKKVTPLTYMRAYLGIEHHPSNWVCGTWEPSTEEYLDASQLETFVPGRSYWMISDWDMGFEVLGEEPENEEVQVVLQPGWNMVSSPYPRSGSWTNLSIHDGRELWTKHELLQSEDPPLWPSIWGWTAGHYQELSSYERWQGFWCLNRRQHNIGLLISKHEDLEHHMIAMEKPSKAALGNVSPPPPPSTELKDQPLHTNSAGGGCLMRAAH